MSAARIPFATMLCFLSLMNHASCAPGDTGGSEPRANDALVHKLLVDGEDASRRWLNGDSSGYTNLMAHTDRFTIFGPLGGPSPVGWSEGFAKAQAAGAHHFHGSVSSTTELVQSYVSDSLVVLVKIERNNVRIADRKELEEWGERSTEVYEREGSEWKLVHRHSDPLIERRSLAQTLDLFHLRRTADPTRR